MSKEESTIIKGVAILLMIFMHLFTHPDIANYCTPLLYIDGMPFVHILSRACGPVPFFIIVSGYGLQYTYLKNKLSFKSQCKRLLKLFIYYWIILIVFVSIGHFIHPEKYPGSTWNIIGNLTSYLNSYNAEHWFLFPYALLALSANYIFKLMDKLGNTWSLLLFFVVSFTSAYFISRYIAVNKDYDSVLAHILAFTGMFFSFAVGSVMCRIAQVRNIKNKYLSLHPSIALLILLSIIAVRCTFTTSAIDGFYVFAFIWLFLHIPLYKYVKALLITMGKHSMPMWLTHSFFCYYLFKDFTYGFEYPLIIYAMLVTISYFISFPIMWLSDYIFSHIITAPSKQQ